MNNININLAEFGGVIAALLIVGAIFKNAFPNFPNRLIPLFTWVLGVLAYLALSKGWTDATQWIAAIIAAATATGTHSGIKNSFQKPDGDTLKMGVLLVGLATLLTGCATSDPVYKPAAVAVVTAERASDAWLDYYVWAKRQPGADLNKLETQNNRARGAWETYQVAMETVYTTRKLVREGILTGDSLEQNIRAAGLAAQAVVTIVLELLPASEHGRLTP